MEFNFTPTYFQWAEKTERIFNSKEFCISNKNSGIEKSSFFLKDMPYTLVISTKPEDINKYATSLNGIPTLCGTEEDNQFMEDDEDEIHERTFALVNKDIDVVFGKNFLEQQNLFNKEIFVYLIENNNPTV